jgi:acid phosphatase class B
MPQYTYKNMIISFDFDGTLCWLNKENISILRRNIEIFNCLKKHLRNKDEVIIVTFRNQNNEIEELKTKESRVLICDYIRKYNLNIKKIIFTNHKPKKKYLLENNVDIHYDDCIFTIKSLESTNIKGILVKNKIK